MRDPTAIIIAISFAVTATSHADSTGGKERANALYEEGNKLFGEQAYTNALDKYKAALALWDNPLIRFNTAITEIQLDRMLDAADDLEAALRDGQAPFRDADAYRNALRYQKLVAARVGQIEVTCDQPAVKVQLDGNAWFDCPGTRRVRVLAGRHAVVGEKTGFLTRSEGATVIGGEVTAVRIALVSLDDAVQLEYPIARWAPWAIAGAGTAVALAGLGVWWSGRNDYRRFTIDIGLICPDGCDLAAMPELADERSSALLKGKIGIAMMAAGGVATVGGLVLAIINRPRRALPRVEIVPAPKGIGALWRF